MDKNDVIFNTSLWLFLQPKRFGGIGPRIRAFQPSRSHSKIMNPSSSKNEYPHIESVLTHKKRNDLTVLNQSASYEINNNAWLNLSGDTSIIFVKLKFL